MAKKSIRWYMTIYTLLILLSLFSIFPIVWVILSSIKPTSQIYTIPPRLLPTIITFVHYLQIFKDPRMLRYFLNSFIISSSTTLFTSFVGMLAGYGFSRFRFILSKPLYIGILGSRMLPRPVMVLPLYFLFVA